MYDSFELLILLESQVNFAEMAEQVELVLELRLPSARVTVLVGGLDPATKKQYFIVNLTLNSGR